MAIQYGRVPMFGFIDRYIASKQEGFGWDNLGLRDVKWVTLHRMVGNLWGTDGYFRDPNVSSITDFGIGIESVSGKANAGIILRWNDPLGYRSGWASGPVSAPYGDGLAAVQKYGINGVNRFGVSIEGDGTDQPFDDYSWGELVHFVAYWADQAQVPYTSFPLNPETGFSFLIFHEEFTYGTGKRCPFAWLKAAVQRLIDDVKVFLQKYQEGTVAGPVVTPPAPIPVPPKTWSTPKPVRELALLHPDDAPFYTTVNGTSFEAIFDTVECLIQTPQKMYAIDGPVSDTIKVVGPDLKPGNRVVANYKFKNDKGTEYLYLSNHARVELGTKDNLRFKRVED